MKYKIEKGTETWSKLSDIWKRKEDCNKIAKDLVEELGFEEFGIDQDAVGGGISCIYSEEKPKGWKTVGKKYQNLIYPKANNKDLIKRFNELPIVSKEEYHDCIGFEPKFSGMYYHRSYGCAKVGGVFLIEVAEDYKFEPPKDLIEILTSEYKELKSKVK